MKDSSLVIPESACLVGMDRSLLATANEICSYDAAIELVGRSDCQTLRSRNDLTLRSAFSIDSSVALLLRGSLV